MLGCRLSISLMWMFGWVCSSFFVSGASPAPDSSLRASAEAGTETLVQMQGTVTFVDAERKLLVLQDADEVLPLYSELADQGVNVGDRVELEGKVGPFFKACPRFPDQPDGSEVRSPFEAPSDWAEHFLSRLRGILHPTVSGDYTFWIASDDSSELWLSDSDDPAGARRIAQVPSGRWTESRQWTRIPSQQSAPIRLEADRGYYLEAIGQDTASRDGLAVAWQGRGFARTVIDGQFVTPLPAAGEESPESMRNNGALWEYWTNFHSTDFSVLRKPDDDVLKLTRARLLKCEAGELPDPVMIRDGQSLAAQAAFRRVELEGRVRFFSRLAEGWLMELECGGAIVTAHIRAVHELDRVLPLNSLVRVSGFFEPMRGLERETQTGMLWVNGGEAITWLDTEENWSLIQELPQQRLKAANPELSVGRMVHTQGRVVAQEGPDLWRLVGMDTIQGFMSLDGTNWSSAGSPIELNLSDETLVGFAISSHQTGELAMVAVDQVSGLSLMLTGADIGNPPMAGSVDDLQGSLMVRGSGQDIWHQADQCFFAYQTRDGSFQVEARLAEFRSNDPNAKAVLMIRESLARDSPWAGLTVMPDYRVGVQGRQESGGNSIGELTVLAPSDRWLKLVRLRNSFLLRTSSDSLESGQLLEVLGKVGWNGEEFVIETPRIRRLPVATESVTSVPPSAPSAGDFSDVLIEELGTEAENALQMARLATVRIRGVVTFNDQVGDAWYCFVQDRSGSVQVQWRVPTLRPLVHAGDWVELTGTPTLTASEVELAVHGITRLGRGEMPDPLRFQLGVTRAAVPDGQWVEIEGVGRLSPLKDRLLLMSRLGELEVFTGSVPPSQFTHWVNARLRVRGVMLQRPDPLLLLPSGRHFQIVEPPPEDPFGVPVFPVHAVQAGADDSQPARRLKVAGTVTCRRSDWLVVQDSTGGIRVETRAAATVEVGDEIQAVGFPVERGIGVVLSDPLLRPVGSGQAITPVEIAGDGFVHVENNGALVSVEAVLLAQHPGGDMQTLDVQAGQRAFQASLPVADGRLRQIAVGSRLRLTGVAIVDGATAASHETAGNGGLVGAVELLLRAPGDVVVVERPPWWNWKYTAAAVGLVFAVFAGAVSWIRTLRGRVEERTHELRETMGKLQKETRISATLAERDRLAGEIHDSIEQGLSAIMMQMDAAEELTSQPDEVRRCLMMAKNMASFSRTEVQHAVWDMQSPLLEDADLPTALRRVAGDISAGDMPQVNVEIVGTVLPLASAVEHHLLRIAQEAMTNAVKHGHAHTIWLSLQYQPGCIHLMIRDDGAGFVPEEMSTEGGHFGLHGMRSRAQKMDAELNLHSKPGEGTCIDVVVQFKNPTPPNG